MLTVGSGIAVGTFFIGAFSYLTTNAVIKSRHSLNGKYVATDACKERVANLQNSLKKIDDDIGRLSGKVDQILLKGMK